MRFRFTETLPEGPFYWIFTGLAFYEPTTNCLHKYLALYGPPTHCEWSYDKPDGVRIASSR